VAARRKPNQRRRRPKASPHASRPAVPKSTGHARPGARRTPGRSRFRAALQSAAARAEIEQLRAVLAAETDVTRGLQQLLTTARQLTGAEAGTVYVRRGESLEFAAVQNDVLARQVGAEEVRRRVASRPLSLRENSIASYVMVTRTTVNLRDAYAIPVDRPYTLLREVDRKTDYRTRSMLALPLRDARGRVFGVLQLINALDPRGAVRPFTLPEQQLVHELAAQVAHLAGVGAG
jgi:GAF domain-containing protein